MVGDGAVGIGAGDDVVVGVVGEGGGQRQPGGIDNAVGAAVECVVAVFGGNGVRAAGAFDDRQGVTGAVEAVFGAQVEAVGVGGRIVGIHDHRRGLTQLVVFGAGDGAVGVGHLDAIAQTVVGVGGGEVEDVGIDATRGQAAGGIIGELGDGCRWRRCG